MEHLVQIGPYGDPSIVSPLNLHLLPPSSKHLEEDPDQLGVNEEETSKDFFKKGDPKD